MKYYAVEYHTQSICPIYRNDSLVAVYLGEFTDQVEANKVALERLGGDKCICSVVFVRARRWTVFNEQEYKSLKI